MKLKYFAFFCLSAITAFFCTQHLLDTSLSAPTTMYAPVPSVPKEAPAPLPKTEPVSVAEETTPSPAVVEEAPEPALEPLPMPPHVITITETHNACRKDDDCGAVATRCACDCGGPVNIRFRRKYMDEKKETCRQYDGPTCELRCDRNIRCIDNQCTDVGKKFEMIPR